MDQETLALMSHGCKLARDLEGNMPNLLNQPHSLLKSCDEIITVFNSIKGRLSRGQMSSIGQSSSHEIRAEVQEWLRSGGATSHQAMDLLNAPTILGRRETFDHDHRDEYGLDINTRDVEILIRGGGISGDIEPSPCPIRASSSSQRQRRRKDEADRIVKRVAAPQMGNVDLPPDDGYIWRKYGQKEILGTRYPRSYYRCTHQKLYSCPAKKQAQRLDHDPSTFEITYRGSHTCQTFSTGPSDAVRRPERGPVQPTSSTMEQPPPLPSFSSSLPTSIWLSMQILQDLDSVSASSAAHSSTSSMVAGGDGGAGPSTSRFPDYQLLAPLPDMEDAMLYSGSSSKNDMDVIFSSRDEKWDSDEKKKD